MSSFLKKVEKNENLRNHQNLESTGPLKGCSARHAARYPGFQPWKIWFQKRCAIERDLPQGAGRQSFTSARQMGHQTWPEKFQQWIRKISKVGRKNSKSCSEDFQMADKLLAQILARVIEITNKTCSGISQNRGRKNFKTRPEE